VNGHTPGPWDAVRRRDGIGIRGANAFVPFGYEANANLIAAAPDLLEVVREFVRDVHHYPADDLAGLEAKALAAISKAEGTP
jgi:hypothetical protein